MMAEGTMASSAWKVESQLQGIEAGPGGNFVRGYTINFVTTSGVRGSVFVPMPVYTSAGAADTIRQMIATHAAQLESVQNLAG